MHPEEKSRQYKCKSVYYQAYEGVLWLSEYTYIYVLLLVSMYDYYPSLLFLFSGYLHQQHDPIYAI